MGDGALGIRCYSRRFPGRRIVNPDEVQVWVAASSFHFLFWYLIALLPRKNRGCTFRQAKASFGFDKARSPETG